VINSYSPNLLLSNDFMINTRNSSSSRSFPIRTLMYSHALNYTGAPLALLDLSVGLFERKNIIPVIVSSEDGPLRQIYEQKGIQVFILQNNTNIKDYIGYIEHIENIKQELSKLNKELSFDVICANTLNPFFVIDWAYQQKIPSIWMVHENRLGQFYFNYLADQDAAKALKCFGYPYRVIFASYSSQKLFSSGNTKMNSTVIYNLLAAANLSEEITSASKQQARSSLGVQPDEIMLLNVGAVAEHKNQEDLIKAIAYLPKKYSKIIKCFIVGYMEEVPYGKKIKQIISGLPEHLRERINLIPTMPSSAIGCYYAASDIYICTSKEESFSRVILEAMACSLPIITTPIEGIKEQVIERVNSVFYNIGDFKGLAEKIIYLIENGDVMKTFSENSKSVLQRLGAPEEAVLNYERILKEAASV